MDILENKGLAFLVLNFHPEVKIRKFDLRFAEVFLYIYLTVNKTSN